MIALGAAIIIHVFLGYALITGLALKAIKHIVDPMKTVNVKEDKPPPDEPPPPPPKQQEIPPFVPPPIVDVQTDSPPPPIDHDAELPRRARRRPRRTSRLRLHRPRRRLRRGRRRRRPQSAARLWCRKTITRQHRCAPRSRAGR